MPRQAIEIPCERHGFGDAKAMGRGALRRCRQIARVRVEAAYRPGLRAGAGRVDQDGPFNTRQSLDQLRRFAGNGNKFNVLQRYFP